MKRKTLRGRGLPELDGDIAAAWAAIRLAIESFPALRPATTQSSLTRFCGGSRSATCRKNASSASLIGQPECALQNRPPAVPSRAAKPRRGAHRPLLPQRRALPWLLAVWKAQLEAQAANLPGGPQKDGLLRKIRQLETAAHMSLRHPDCCLRSKAASVGGLSNFEQTIVVIRAVLYSSADCAVRRPTPPSNYTALAACERALALRASNEFAHNRQGPGARSAQMPMRRSTDPGSQDPELNERRNRPHVRMRLWRENLDRK
jgi:hypothetical protein